MTSDDFSSNDPPTPPTDSANAGFVAHWKKLGPQLEEIRAQEQALMTQEQRWQAIDRVLDLSYQFRTERPLTGLIELQRIFMKAWGNERNR